MYEEKENTSSGPKLDKAFVESILENDAIEQILNQGEAFRTLMAYYKCAIMEVETKFNVLNTEFSLKYDRNPIETIKSRLKSPESIIEKLHRKELEFSAACIERELSDIAGVRVVCAFPEDIYELADCFLKQDDIKLITKKDYILHPKENGYRSLHLIVEHRIYYKKGQNNSELRRELKECAEISAALDIRMQDIRSQLDETEW